MKSSKNSMKNHPSVSQDLYLCRSNRLSAAECNNYPWNIPKECYDDLKVLNSANPITLLGRSSDANNTCNIIYHEGVMNFGRTTSMSNVSVPSTPRSPKTPFKQCIMCGRQDDVIILPSQNKHICKICDSSFWLYVKYSFVFKFCKGCKNFFALSEFNNKPGGTKCFKCQERGRHNRLLKKMQSETLLLINSNNNSNSNNMTQNKEPDNNTEDDEVHNNNDSNNIPLDKETILCVDKDYCAHHHNSNDHDNETNDMMMNIARSKTTATAATATIATTNTTNTTIARKKPNTTTLLEKPCVIYIEELLSAPVELGMVVDGACTNCKHPVNQHLRKPVITVTTATTGYDATNVVELKQTMEKIVKLMDPIVERRQGSSVKTDDFVNTFRFTSHSVNVIKDVTLYSWNHPQFNYFKGLVKMHLLANIDTFIAYANSSDKLEDSSLKPILHTILDALLPVAFSSYSSLNVEVIIERFTYNNAKIKNCKGNLQVFNGETDLSCMLIPNQIPICGFENQVPKKSMTMKRSTTRVEEMNNLGKKACSQIASQILGAITHLHTLNIPVPIYTQMGTNGWQYVLVRRMVTAGKQCKFVSSVPVSLGIAMEVRGVVSVVKKPFNDPCYDIVAHMIALMFDNARYLVAKVVDGATLSIPINLLKIDEHSSDDEEEEEDDDEEGYGDDRTLVPPSNIPIPSSSTANKSTTHQSRSSQSSSKATHHKLHQHGENFNENKGRRGGKEEQTKHKQRRIPLAEIDCNFMIPTLSAVRYHNTIM